MSQLTVATTGWYATETEIAINGTSLYPSSQEEWIQYLTSTFTTFYLKRNP